VSTDRSAPPSGAQLHLIARYCTWLGIRERLEEKPKTIGEANEMINRLQDELAARKKKRNEIKMRIGGKR
jgi:hypothetical protein